MLINGTPGDDDLRGTRENDTLVGSGGNDRLAGATGNDFLNGGFGDDTLLGGFGDDTITFGAGEKIVNGNEGNDVINLNFTSVTDDDFSLIYNSSDGGVTSEGVLSGTRIEGIEELNVRSGDGNDRINISGASEGSVVNTGRGNDLILGSSGDDELIASSGDDSINGDEGDDTIVGGFGDDILNGQSGNDVITFGAGANIVNGGGGDDLLELDFSALTADVTLLYNQFEGPTVTDRGILEGTEIDEIQQANVRTGAGNDFIDVAATTTGGILSSGDGFDSLIGGSGDDELQGGADNDVYFGSIGSDTIDGGEGNEDVAVFAGNADDYRITFEDNLVTLDDGTDVDQLSNIDFLRFEDGDINVETERFTSIEEIEALLGRGRDEPAPDEESELSDSQEDTESDDANVVGEDGEDGADSEDVEIDGERVAVGGDGGDSGDIGEELESLDDIGEDLASEQNIAPETTQFISNVEDNADTELDGELVYQLSRTDNQTQFFTTSEAERDSVLETQPEYELDTDSFISADAPAEGEDIIGISPVYSFFNTNTESYLCTSEEQEKSFITENLDNYVFEGIAYYSFDTQVEGTVPLYCVYNTQLGSHSFTTSTAQRDSFLKSDDFVAEGDENGIVFYVEPVVDM